MGSFEDKLENRFLTAAVDRFTMEYGVRSAGSYGEADVTLARGSPSGIILILAELKSFHGEKLSLTEDVWDDVLALRELTEMEGGVYGYLWLRPKSLTALRGLDEHEKFFGFNVWSIEREDSPLHYEDGMSMKEVLG